MRRKIIRFVTRLLFGTADYHAARACIDGKFYDTEVVCNEKYGDLVIFRFRIVGLPEGKEMRRKILNFVSHLLFPNGGGASAKFSKNGSWYDLDELGNEKFGDTLIVRFRVMNLENLKKKDFHTPEIKFPKNPPPSRMMELCEEVKK